MTRPLTVQDRDGGIDSCGNPAVFTWKGCGRYRGFLFQPLGVPVTRSDPNAFGLLDVASFRMPRRLRMPVPLATRGIPDGHRLSAGRYRVHVLCDGAGEVRIPTLRADLPRSRVVNAGSRSAFEYRERPVILDSSLGPRAPAAVVSLPAPVDGGPAYVGAVTHTYVENYPMPVTGGYPGIIALTDACIDGVGNLDMANACDMASRYGRHVWGRQGTFNSDGSATQDSYLVFQPGGISEGDHTSYHTAATAGTSAQESIAAAFILRP